MKTCLSEPFFIHLLCVKVKLLENPAFPTVNLCSVSESWRVRTGGDRRAVWRRKLRPQGWGTHLRSHSQSLTATALRSGSFARIHTQHFSGMTDRRTKVKEFVWIETKVNCLSQTQRPLGKKNNSYQTKLPGPNERPWSPGKTCDLGLKRRGERDAFGFCGPNTSLVQEWKFFITCSYFYLLPQYLCLILRYQNGASSCFALEKFKTELLL